MKGLLIALGKQKGGSSSKDKASPLRAYAREAFGAIKEDDEDGFVEAFLAAVNACKSKSEDEDEYED